MQRPIIDLFSIWMYVLECCFPQWEVIELVKDYTSEHAQLEVENYLGLTPKSDQSFQGLIHHLSLASQSCKMVNSQIGDFYNQSQKPRETGDAFADKLQILVRMIVACKPKFLGDTNQALKHQYAHNQSGGLGTIFDFHRLQKFYPI